LTAANYPTRLKNRKCNYANFLNYQLKTLAPVIPKIFPALPLRKKKSVF